MSKDNFWTDKLVKEWGLFLVQNTGSYDHLLNRFKQSHSQASKPQPDMKPTITGEYSAFPTLGQMKERIEVTDFFGGPLFNNQHSFTFLTSKIFPEEKKNLQSKKPLKAF